ncbi:MAG: hypothetical protein K0S68_142 [Candidatus Saccharibacteria bacterium]|jgi:hypothetical protein|nr:hypothetical protein [Candidatus Saccharibacteria bacterium]
MVFVRWLAAMALAALLLSAGTTASAQGPPSPDPGGTATPGWALTAPTEDPTGEPMPYPTGLPIEPGYCHEAHFWSSDFTLIVEIWPDGGYTDLSGEYGGMITVSDDAVHLTRSSHEFQAGDALTWTKDGNVEVIEVRAAWVDQNYNVTADEALPVDQTTVGVKTGMRAVAQLVVCAKHKGLF